LVDPSPWPLYISYSVFILFSRFVSIFNNRTTYTGKCPYRSYWNNWIIIRFFFISFCIIRWWKDVVRESTFIGYHTVEVRQRLKSRILFFIFSEVMFFFSFFWAFFNSTICSERETRLLWPPIGLETLEAIRVPLLNTVTLLSSRVSVTWSHHALILSFPYYSILRIITTILLRVFFTLLQRIEYYTCTYTIASRNYRSIFFILTGFHRLHVLVRTIFLIVSLSRIIKSHIDPQHHFRILFSIWYWHFVDVVWLFLYLLVYLWRNNCII